MINNNLRMASGTPWFSNPTLKINFENGWIDEKKGTAWIPENANITTNPTKKFGSWGFMANEITSQGAYTPYSTNQDVGDKDFVMAFWYQVQNNIQTSAICVAGCPNSFAIQIYGGGLLLNLWTTNATVIHSTPTNPLPSYNTWHYIKAGRKGTKLFLNVNSQQFSTTIPQGASATVTGGGFQIGYGEGNIARYIDSFIFVIGDTDDSLDIPTAPF